MKESQVERAGWLSIAVNVFLTLLNLLVLLASGSLAVAAEMIHNLVDLMASIAVLAGLKISQRQSRQFPYGLYKVENLVAVVISLLIFVAGYEIARRAILGEQTVTVVTPWVLAGVFLSMTVPFAFSFFEMRVGRAANSPSLIADAHEYRIHVFSSGVVLLALLAHVAGFPLDRLAAVVVVILIVKTGWELLTDGMRVLLDASLDAQTLAAAREIVTSFPAVSAIRELTGRNAGRYRFLEASVGLRVSQLEQAHQISEQITERIRREIPHVERVLIHIEPEQKPVLRVAVSLSDRQGMVSEHFGTAPFFSLTDVRVADGVHLRQSIVLNPHQGDPKQRGLNVARWLLEEHVDTVLSGDSLQDKAPGYALSTAGIQLQTTQSPDQESALLDWYAQQELG